MTSKKTEQWYQDFQNGKEIIGADSSTIVEARFYRNTEFSRKVCECAIQDVKFEQMTRFGLFQMIKYLMPYQIAKLLQHMDAGACNYFLRNQKFEKQEIQMGSEQTICTISEDVNALSTDDEISQSENERSIIKQDIDKNTHKMLKKVAKIMLQSAIEHGEPEKLKEMIKYVRKYIQKLHICCTNQQKIQIILQELFLLQIIDLSHQRCIDFIQTMKTTQLQPQCLIALNLSYCDIDKEQLIELSQIFTNLQNLQRINIDHNPIGTDGASYLFNQVYRLKYLTYISVSYCQFSGDALIPLMYAMNKLKIHHLDISNNRLGNQDTELVIKIMENQYLKELICWNHMMDQISGEQIIKWLQQKTKVFDKLRFSTKTMESDDFLTMLNLTKERDLTTKQIRQIYEQNLVYGADQQNAPEWYKISKKWLNCWISFVSQNGPMPGKIDNTDLDEQSKLNTDYYLVSEEVWQQLIKIYGIKK